MTEIGRCPECGAPRSGGSPGGPCPACLMQLGLASAPAKDVAAAESPVPADVQATYVPAKGTQPPSPEELSRHFPELEILGLLGRGGMGAVYKARQRELDRLVALKIIIPDAADEAEFAERFTREARILARLNHPHIVTIHDFGRREGLFYLIMEYVDGVNLRELMRARKVPPREALEIVPRLCEALQFAHDEGIVHRDIKPENILVDRKGRVKIADFGLAKLAGPQPHDFALTGTRQIVGTPHYMAPEQMQGSRGVDHRADIYSLGVVFYEMLTGELPVGRFEPPSHHARLDVRVDEVVLRSLERDPERRYQQASEIKTAVETIARSVAAAAATSVPAGVGDSAGFSRAWSNFTWVWKVPRRLTRKSLFGLGLAAGVVCLLLLLAFTPFAQHKLVAAAEEGAVRTVEFWLAIGVDANATNDQGETALLRAAGGGHTAVIERLLARGARVDAANEHGTTPLMWASWQGHGPAVGVLLKHHADINKRSNDGETALHKGAFRGHTVVVQNLLDYGAVVDESDQDGETALILAASQGHQPIVRLLLDRGANPRAATRGGWTPLMAAARNGHQSVAEQLLPVSRIEAVDKQGETALTLALTGGNLGVVDLLLSAGAQESGALWLWRGFRLARTGQSAEALTWFEKAAADSRTIGRPWSFTIDGVQYVVPAPACFAWLVVGTCRRQLDKSAQAGEAYRQGLANVPASSEALVLFRSIEQVPGRSYIEQFETRRDEIQRHVENPDAAWHVRVAYERDEWQGGSHSRQTGHTDREVRDFSN